MTLRKRMQRRTSGSPHSGEPEYLLVGRMRRTHGVHGELLMEVVTDFPDHLQAGARIFLGDSYREAVIENSRRHAHGLLVLLEGVGKRELADPLQHAAVWVRTSDRPRLPDGVFYHHELLGCQIVDEAEKVLGVLKEILQTGANDVYVVGRDNAADLLLPVIPGVVLEIDPPLGSIKVRIPPGLEHEVPE